MATPHGIKHGYRSGLEEKVAKELEDAGIKYSYEKLKVTYQVNEMRTYTPDFVIGTLVIETKGRFTTADRKKHLLIQKQHPLLDIRFVFSNPNAKLYKGAKTTYADWCDKHGFMWAKKTIPKEWLDDG